MANIDVSALLSDPDFIDQFTLIKRTVSINPASGAAVLTEDGGVLVYGSVQSGSTDDLQFLPAGVRLSDLITVYYSGELSVERVNGYSDLIVWNGRRYTVQDIDGDWLNWGAGYIKAICVLEAMTNE